MGGNFLNLSNETCELDVPKDHHLYPTIYLTLQGLDIGKLKYLFNLSQLYLSRKHLNEKWKNIFKEKGILFVDASNIQLNNVFYCFGSNCQPGDK